MNKMHAFVKGIASLAVAIGAYVDQNLSPLFWALLALAGVDLLINIRHEGQQLKKLGAAFFALGLPGWLASHTANLLTPESLKVIIAILTIGYLQIVVPDVLALIAKLKLTGNKTVDTTIDADLASAVSRIVASEMAKAQAQNVAQAGVVSNTSNGGGGA